MDDYAKTFEAMLSLLEEIEACDDPRSSDIAMAARNALLALYARDTMLDAVPG